jgi:hypothetical protein
VTAVVAGKGAQPLTEGESGGLLERQPAGDGRVRLARVDHGAQLPDFDDRHGLLRHGRTMRAVDGGAVDLLLARRPSSGRPASVARSRYQWSGTLAVGCLFEHGRACGDINRFVNEEAGCADGPAEVPVNVF